MTGEEFRSRYQLGEQLTEPPVVSLRALDTSGSPVLVHFLLGNAEVDSTTLLEEVRRADAPIQGQVQEIEEVDGVPVVVSSAVPDFKDFRAWLVEAGAGDSAPSKGETKTPGAYTQLFRVPAQQAGVEPLAPEQPGHQMGPQTPADGGEKAPGAYTMTFGQAAGPPQSPPHAMETDGARQAPDTPPGPSRQTTPPPASQPEKKPGTYTMLFGAGAATGQETPEAPAREETFDPPIPPADTQSTSTPTPAPEKRGPGAYTQLFRGSDEGRDREPVAPLGEKPAPGDAAIPTPSDTTPSRPPEPAAPPTTHGEIAPEATWPASASFPAAPSSIEETEKDGTEPLEEPSVTDLLDQGDDQPNEPTLGNVVFPTIPAPPPQPAGGEGEPKPIQAADPKPGAPPSTERQTGPTEAGHQPPAAEGEAPRQSGAYTQMFGRERTHDSGEGERTPAYEPPVSPRQPPEGPRYSGSSEPTGPHWQRWKDTPGASGRHIPSDDYLHRLRSPADPGPIGPTGGTGAHREVVSDPGIGGPLFPSGGDLRNGPGHYTMVREGLVPHSSPASSGAPSFRGPPPSEGTDTRASAPSRKTFILTVLGLVVIVLAAVAVVVVFALTS